MMEIGDILSSHDKLKKICLMKSSKLKNNKIVLINCPQFKFENFEAEVAKNKGYYAYQPTGLQCLYSVLTEEGYDVKIFDLNFELLKKVNGGFDHRDWLGLVKEKLEEINPSIVGISNFYKVDENYFIEICKLLRSEDKYIIIGGGQNATYNAKLFIKNDYVDFICERESENKIKYLINCIYGKDFVKTEGIYFKYKDEVVRSDGTSDIVLLKGNLIEAHKSIPVEEYCRVGSLNPFSRMVGKDTPFCGILLNRGCIGNCKFCDVVDYMGKGVRSRNPKDFLDEMEYLVKERGVKHFDIIDDDFAQYKGVILEVLNGMCERGFKISWASNNGLIACTLDREIMRLMRDSGCVGFKIGVESGNPDILRLMRKPGTLDTFLRFSEIAQEFPEMFISDNYIIGFPGENFEKIMQSFYFSIKMNLDWASYAVYQQNVNYFNEEEKEEARKGNIGDFLPGKDYNRGKLSGVKYQGLDIFKMPKEEIPSREQLNEIWFTFNFIRNFIINKNLYKDESITKFIRWVEVLEERYPLHPYMNFSLSLAYLIVGNEDKAWIQKEKMIKNLEDDYWKRKMEKLGLMDVINNFPNDSEGAKEALTNLKFKYEKCLE